MKSQRYARVVGGDATELDETPQQIQEHLLAMALEPRRQLEGDIVVLLVYLESNEVEPLIGVVRSREEVRALTVKLGLDTMNPPVWWQPMPLQGSSGPHTVWPDPELVYIVGTGGIDDLSGDTGRSPIASGVFTDRSAARAFADEECKESDEVTLRTVRVGESLR